MCFETGNFCCCYCSNSKRMHLVVMTIANYSHQTTYIYYLNEHIIKLALFIFHLSHCLVVECWRIHKTSTATRVKELNCST